MDNEKIKELEAKVALAESSRTTSEQEASALKAQLKTLTEQIATEKKIKSMGVALAFVEANKAVITPSVAPAFLTLCESVGDEEVEVKLGETPEKIGKMALVMRFAEILIKAKAVPLGEAITGEGEVIPVKGAVKGASAHVELHEKAMGLIAKNKDLSYVEAVRVAVKAEPELAH